MKTEPDDLGGWMKLANAYQVLNETDKALDAYRQASRLTQALPASDPRRGSVEAAIKKLTQ